MEKIRSIIHEGKEYRIAVNGQKAVDIANKINAGKCYSRIKINDSFAAQMEVTIDEDGEYNGRKNKWVDFSFIPANMVESVIIWLEENGFSGCFALFTDEEETEKEISFVIPEAMENNHVVLHGDKVTAMGFTFAVDNVLFQEFYYDDGFDCEFKDNKGNYHHWKQWEDKGNLLRWDGRKWRAIR